MKQNLTEATLKATITAAQTLPKDVNLVTLKFIAAGDSKADDYMWKGWQILDKDGYSEMTAEINHANQVAASNSHEINANGH